MQPSNLIQLSSLSRQIGSPANQSFPSYQTPKFQLTRCVYQPEEYQDNVEPEYQTLSPIKLSNPKIPKELSDIKHTENVRKKEYLISPPESNIYDSAIIPKFNKELLPIFNSEVSAQNEDLSKIDRFRMVAFTILEPFLVLILILFRYCTLVYEQYIIGTDSQNQSVNVIFLAIILLHTMINLNFSISKYKEGTSPHIFNVEVLLIILTVTCDYSIILIENLPLILNIICFFVSMIQTVLLTRKFTKRLSYIFEKIQITFIIFCCDQIVYMILMIFLIGLFNIQQSRQQWIQQLCLGFSVSLPNGTPQQSQSDFISQVVLGFLKTLTYFYQVCYFGYLIMTIKRYRRSKRGESEHKVLNTLQRLTLKRTSIQGTGNQEFFGNQNKQIILKRMYKSKILNIMKQQKYLNFLSLKFLDQLAEQCHFQVSSHYHDFRFSKDLIIFVCGRAKVLQNLSQKFQAKFQIQVIVQCTKKKKYSCFGSKGFFQGWNDHRQIRVDGKATILKIDNSIFYSLLNKFQDDKERYFMFIDRLTFQNRVFRMDIFNLDCYVCGKNSHAVEECSLINYMPDRIKIIKNGLMSQPMMRGKKIGSRRASFNALFEMQYISKRVQFVETNTKAPKLGIQQVEEEAEKISSNGFKLSHFSQESNLKLTDEYISKEFPKRELSKIGESFQNLRTRLNPPPVEFVQLQRKQSENSIESNKSKKKQSDEAKSRGDNSVQRSKSNLPVVQEEQLSDNSPSNYTLSPINRVNNFLNPQISEVDVDYFGILDKTNLASNLSVRSKSQSVSPSLLGIQSQSNRKNSIISLNLKSDPVIVKLRPPSQLSLTDFEMQCIDFNIDQVKSYQIFYPEFNVENVLKKLNRQRGK